jgi:hypothetical protein
MQIPRFMRISFAVTICVLLLSQFNGYVFAQSDEGRLAFLRALNTKTFEPVAISARKFLPSWLECRRDWLGEGKCAIDEPWQNKIGFFFGAGTRNARLHVTFVCRKKINNINIDDLKAAALNIIRGMGFDDETANKYVSAVCTRTVQKEPKIKLEGFVLSISGDHDGYYDYYLNAKIEPDDSF